MKNIKRLLNIELPKRQSAFLWGARKTGKSTHLKTQFPDAIYYDLLQSDIYLKYLAQPHLLRQDVLALSEKELQQPIIIDEVQKAPLLLDEIHWLIENTSAQFIMCGSSARKLKRGAANLLGGRAWRYEFFPLVSNEIGDIDLLQAMNRGLIPSHYLSEHHERLLTSYVQDYLIEEIKAEGLTRNLPAFARFLEAVAYTNGELVNYTSIARDCSVDKNTVKEYYQVLQDTLVGYFLMPYKNRFKRTNISLTPKFYLFDMGVVNFMSKTTIVELKGINAGRSFEHFILMELMAYRGIYSRNFDITYWRNKSGLEVDFVLGKAATGIEVKISDNPRLSELKGLVKFKEEYPESDAYVISLAPRARKLMLKNDTYITVLPWKQFLTMLWENKLKVN